VVTAVFHPSFKHLFSKIKDKTVKQKLIKQFEKIRDNPEIGTPMKYVRKGTREVYVAPYRLSYMYLKDEDKIIFLEIYHKDQQ
jgi:mRNA-degrading endonuclease RelE of RelBE toxin-antitoxin system